MENTITSSVALWAEIEKTAQFKDQEYDEALLQHIRAALGFPRDGEINVLLEQRNVSCEKLLMAVLDSLMPFSRMINDLLDMFKEAHAQQADHNLKIQFDFDRNYKIDLSAFRQQVEDTRTYTSKALARVPVQPYRMLVYPIRMILKENYINNLVSSYPSEIQMWLDAYEKCPKGSWPDYLPALLRTDFDELNEQFEILWQIIDASLWKCRNEFSKPGRLDCQNIVDVQFWQDETDRWIGQLVCAACDLRTEIMSRKASERSATAKEFADQIKNILSECKMMPVVVERQGKYVLDILKLPFWKKRYELYSVWISTQILNALPAPRIFHVKNNTLSFSFAGSHIATCMGYNPPLELWAEVRTNYQAPEGGKRKKHIQPDYTLAIGDAYQTNNSVAVVECKQYKKYSRTNFLRAAEDYADGRPGSKVFLTNYGPIPDELIKEAASKLQKQIRFCKEVRPFTEGTSDFKKELREAVDGYYKDKYPVKVPEYPMPAPPYVIKLTWSERPSDLDLHLLYSEGNASKSHTYYGSTKLLPGVPHTSLNQDDRFGMGSEEINIYRCLAGIYDVYVYDYENEQVTSGPISVAVESNGRTLYAISRLEPINKNSCWHVFRICNERIMPINEVVDAFEVGVINKSNV